MIEGYNTIWGIQFDLGDTILREKKIVSLDRIESYPF